jgi:hypothetical protein
MDASPDALVAALRTAGCGVRPFDVHCHRSAFTPKIILLSEYFIAQTYTTV